MVKAIDNLVTDAPLRDIRLTIGPAEALLRDSQDPAVIPEPTAVDEVVAPVPKPLGEEELLERLRARRRARPLSADELDHALARKRRLLDIGEGDAADAARLSEEISRLEAERRNV